MKLNAYVFFACFLLSFVNCHFSIGFTYKCKNMQKQLQGNHKAAALFYIALFHTLISVAEVLTAVAFSGIHEELLTFIYISVAVFLLLILYNVVHFQFKESSRNVDQLFARFVAYSFSSLAVTLLFLCLGLLL